MIPAHPSLRRTKLVHIALWVLALGGLLLILPRNYLLFHSLVELFSIVVAFAVFIVTWNTRRELGNWFLAVAGVGYLFVGGVDLVHTLAYSGMGVFPEAGADLPTQLWILARYLEVGALLAAGGVGLLSTRRDWGANGGLQQHLGPIAAGFAILTGVGLAAILVFDVFPAAFVEGSGLTTFKVGSEYLIVGLLVVALGLLHRQRESFDGRVYTLLSVAIVLTAGAELAFTLYVDVYGAFNALGHVLKLVSFTLVYLAVVKTGITEPHRTLYRSLAQREAESRRFREAVESAGQGVVITDTAGTITYVNPAFERMTGYPAAESVGQSQRVVMGGQGADAATPSPTLQNADGVSRVETADGASRGETADGASRKETAVARRRSGEEYHVERTVSPIPDADGEVTHFVTIQQDVTDRMARSEQLRRYEQAIEGSTDLLAAVDAEFTLLFANRAYRTFHDLAAADVGSTKLTDLLDEEAFEAVRPHLERVVAGEATEFEADRLGPDGTLRTLDMRLYPLRNGDEEVTGVVAAMRDVTDQHRQEAELRESEARYRSLTTDVLDTSEVGTFILGPAFEVVWINQAIERYFGLDREEVVGVDKRRLVRERIRDVVDDSEVFADTVLATYDDNTYVEEFECRIVAGDGREERWLRHWSQPITAGLYEGGRIEHYSDITDRKEREKALQVMDRVLRHNLRNELNVILGHADAVVDRTPSERRQAATAIGETGMGLLEVAEKQRTIVSLLTEPRSMTDHDLARICREATAETREEHPGATVTMDCPPGINVQGVSAFPAAIVELLDNGIRHDSSPAPSVRLTASRQNGTVDIRITDHGPGIPAAERDVLLEDGEIGPLFHGSGLGLWLVNHLVRQSGGSLSFEECGPDGSTVCISVEAATN
ncbi:MAG: MASE3 domain-containing protein [Halodesulfurarchaeum sp.]